MFTRFRPCLRACEQIFQLPGGGFEPAHIPGAGALKAALWDGGNFHSKFGITCFAGPAEPEPPKRARGRCGMINSSSRVLSLASRC